MEEAAGKLNLPVSKIGGIEESPKKQVKTNSFRRMMYPLGTQTDQLQNQCTTRAFFRMTGALRRS